MKSSGPIKWIGPPSVSAPARSGRALTYSDFSGSGFGLGSRATVRGMVARQLIDRLPGLRLHAGACKSRWHISPYGVDKSSEHKGHCSQWGVSNHSYAPLVFRVPSRRVRDMRRARCVSLMGPAGSGHCRRGSRPRSRWAKKAPCISAAVPCHDLCRRPCSVRTAGRARARQHRRSCQGRSIETHSRQNSLKSARSRARVAPVGAATLAVAHPSPPPLDALPPPVALRSS